MPIIVPVPPDPQQPVRGDQAPVLTLSRDSTEIALTENNGWIVLAGVEGLDDPPRALIEVEPATWDGSLSMGARYQARDIFLPLFYSTNTTSQVRVATQSLASLMDIKREPVTLELAHLEGTRRWITGQLSAPLSAGGFEGGEGPLWRKLAVTMHCPDPYWTGEHRYASFSLEGITVSFLSDTFLPMNVNASQVTAGTVITNPGDAEAYPRWTLQGPLAEAQVTVADTDWSLSGPLAEGETLVVDTRRGQQIVMVNDTPAWGRLAQGARLGALPPGESELHVTLNGATAVTSSLILEWQERWLTAW